jgi:hypothetical protein
VAETRHGALEAARKINVVYEDYDDPIMTMQVKKIIIKLGSVRHMRQKQKKI